MRSPFPSNETKKEADGILDQRSNCGQDRAGRVSQLAFSRNGS
ncbi:hypothetical protein STZ1_50093 [Bacillus subtilis]